MKAIPLNNCLNLQRQKARATQVRLFVAACFAASMATPAFAQLAEAENTVLWVLNIFSPALLLGLLSILLIGCGLAVYLG